MKYSMLIMLFLYATSDAKSFEVQIEDNTEIQNLVESFSIYFDMPMSYCKLEPTGIKVTEIGTKQAKILVGVHFYCDRRESQAFFQKQVGNGFGDFIKSTGEWDGIIGQLDTRNTFIKLMNKRYPWFRIVYHYEQGSILIYPTENYAGSNTLNPILFKVIVNGETLHDFRENEQYHFDSIARCDAILSPAEYAYFPVRGMNLKSNNIAESSFNVVYIVSSEQGRRLMQNKNVDIRIERAYKLKTLGWMNRDYSFPSLE